MGKKEKRRLQFHWYLYYGTPGSQTAGLKGHRQRGSAQIRSSVHPSGIPADPAGDAGGHGHDGLHHVPFSRDRHAVGDPGEHPQ